MAKLTPEQRELVALGASFATHCVPCITYHVGKARAVGLPDDAIEEAIRMAELVQKESTRRVREAGASVLQAGETAGPRETGTAGETAGPPDAETRGETAGRPEAEPSCGCDDDAPHSMSGGGATCCGPAFAAAMRRFCGEAESRS